MHFSSVVHVNDINRIWESTCTAVLIASSACSDNPLLTRSSTYLRCCLIASGILSIICWMVGPELMTWFHISTELMGQCVALCCCCWSRFSDWLHARLPVVPKSTELWILVDVYIYVNYDFGELNICESLCAYLRHQHHERWWIQWIMACLMLTLLCLSYSSANLSNMAVPMFRRSLVFYAVIKFTDKATIAMCISVLIIISNSWLRNTLYSSWSQIRIRVLNV